MRQGQKSKRGGIQDILLPMEYFRCLQGDFEGNHPWYACDMSGKDTGRDLCFAPVDVICVGIDANNGNAVWWQSQNKVRFADGTINDLTMMIIHDNNLQGIYLGAKYEQGKQIAQEGSAGYANGNHLHIEVAKGKFSSKYARNAKGYYLPNGIAIETACFADDTIFLTSKHWYWIYTKDVPVQSVTQAYFTLNEIPADFVYEQACFTCKVGKLRVRKAPSLQGTLTPYYYTDIAPYNQVRYDGYVRREGYIWISWIGQDGTRRWMAVGECDEQGINTTPYGTFSV